jgi:prepilin-type N-terminal cleavage/methylation domain-containing protein
MTRAQEGFTVVELLVALAITLLIAGAIAGAVPHARETFDRLPAELEMQQRGRTAIDAMTQALRAADRISFASPDDNGGYSELTAVIPMVNAARGVLALNQSTPGAPMTLALSPCPSVTTLCGFSAGAIAMVADASDHFDVFVVASVDAAQRRITPNHALSRAYEAGSMLVQVEQNTFGLDQQADGTYTLTRVTAAGAIQPMVDFISALSFTVDGRRIDVSVTVHAAAESLRTSIADRTFKTSVVVRHLS